MVSLGFVALFLWLAKPPMTTMASSFDIKTTWDGTQLSINQVTTVKLRKGSDQSRPSLVIEVAGPFYGDPPAPSGAPGKPFPNLWDYEVAEVFFLGNNEKYLEVELCPHGQHLVLILSGRRKMVKDELPIPFTSQIDYPKKTWSGTAEIPLEYLPPGVNKINAYAIHGSGKNRQYEALYPTKKGEYADPDFHRLEYFKSFDFSPFLTKDWKPSPLYGGN